MPFFKTKKSYTQQQSNSPVNEAEFAKPFAGLQRLEGKDGVKTILPSASVSTSSAAQFRSLARYMAWVFLFLIIGLAVFLSFMIGNNARNVLLEKQYAFAGLLGDNLNHQIYRRYTLPTLVGYGRIALRQPAQYERLDQLIEQVIHGMNVQDLRIYDHNGMISYATNRFLLGEENLASPQVTLVSTTPTPLFNLDTKRSYWRSFFTLNPTKGSFILRTTYPLRIENRLSSEEEANEGPVMGVLEFRQDITEDMNNALRFQWSVIGITLVSSLLIFSIMIFFLQKAEKALAVRVEEKERLQAQLHQHEKLAGMGRVIAGIAHEIRNPLGIICSSAELLLRRIKTLDDNSRGVLQAIYDEGHRLSKTVTDFLDYARPREPRQDEVEIATVVNQAVVFMKPELDKHNISMVLDIPVDQNFVVKGDKNLLYRAIYNVLSNACQAIENTANGLVSITVAPGLPEASEGADLPHFAQELPRATLLKQAKEVCITVQDNGPGFNFEGPVNYLDPFFTTKKGGSGLGLAIVSSIVSSHHGRLVLENADGPQTGAVVKIILNLDK